MNENKNIEKVLEDFEHYKELFVRAKSDDSEAIRELVKRSYSFLSDFYGASANHSLDIEMWKVAKTIPCSFHSPLKIPKRLNTKDIIRNKKYIIGYLKLFISSMKSNLVRQCYLDILNNTPVLCFVHENVMSKRVFPVDLLFFDKEIGETQGTEIEIEEYQPKYTLEYLTKLI